MQRRTFISAGIGTGLGAIGLGMAGLPAGTGSLLPGPPLDDEQRLHTGAGLAFGTTMSVQVVHADAALAALAIAEALAAAKKVDRLMTLHRDDSQVMQLNRHAVLHRPDPHVLRVLEFARMLSTSTAGAFDITVQPLWQAYSAAATRGALPDAQARKEALAATGWRRVRLTPERIALDDGMSITLNGVAQGYAVDLAREALAARGIRNALIDTGEFGAQGRKSTRAPWTVGVRDPRDAQALAGVVPMDGRCMATSGDYETFFTPDYLHHHIFDPVTGDSPTQLASVTVLAPTGLEADGWSTAFMVLGRERAIAHAAALQDIDLMLVDKAGTTWRSAGFPAPAV